MRLRYAINVTIDGCVHHEAGLPPDEESMNFWTDEVASARALLYGGRTYELMESAWRRPATGEWPAWMGERDIRFAEVIDATPKHVVSSTLTAPDWQAELVTGDLAQSVAGLKAADGGHLLLGGVRLPLALADSGLIDDYVFVVHPVLAGHGPTLLSGLRDRVSLDLVDQRQLRSGAMVLHYVPAAG